MGGEGGEGGLYLSGVITGREKALQNMLQQC